MIKMKPVDAFEAAGAGLEYDPSSCVVIHKNTDPFGGLLNMFSMAMEVNGIRFRTVEHLYQALRFPALPDVQRRIIEYPSPLMAKRYSRQFVDKGRASWEKIGVQFMDWSIRVKLAWNYGQFGKILDNTGDRVIVEESRKDSFWGAVPKASANGRTLLVGENILGRILMGIRCEFRTKSKEQLMTVSPLEIDHFLLLGEPIQVVIGDRTLSEKTPLDGARDS